MIHSSADFSTNDSFRTIFFDEAQEHLAATEVLLLRMDTEAPAPDDLNAVFRAVHSIKGSAAMLGFDDIAALAHVMENLLDLLRKGERPLVRDDVDAMLQAGDTIKSQVDHLRGLLDAPPDASKAEAMLRARVQLADAPAAPPAVSSQLRRFSVRLGPLAAPIDADELDMMLTGLAEMGAVENRSLDNVSGGHVCFDAALEGTEFDLRSVLSLVVPPEQIAIQAGAAPAVKRAAPPPNAAPRYAHPENARDEFFVDPVEFKRRRDLAQCNAARAAPAAATESIVPAFEVPAPGEEGASVSPRLPHAAGEQSGAPVSPVAKAAAADATSIRVATDKIDLLVNLVGELIITESMLSSQGTLGESAGRQSGSGLADLARHTRNLQEAVLAIRMVPIANVFARFPRFARALADNLGKRVELVTSGESTELDRGLIEQISDPLMHLVRNSIDHGLESPEGRAAAGKPATGRVSLAASQRGGKVVIEVGDDGRGLNRDRILARAAARGMSIAEDAPDAEVWQLVFEAGFTTAEAVTDVSGRGVGMDVVRRNILSLGGAVDIASTTGEGTKVTVSIPLTLAIINGFLVGVGRATYVIPLGSVVECLQLGHDDAARIGETGYLNLRGKVLPLLRLRDVFETAREPGKRENVVVVDYGGQQAGLVVDSLLGEFQTVIKPLGKLFDRLAGISGSTILGSGEVALILDVPYLIHTCATSPARIA
jgi:two-component system, chemotaxis family, sensor kinase CheA